MYREIATGTRDMAQSRAFHTEFLHSDHQGADEFVSALEAKKFILPVGFIEEDDVERDRVGFVHCSEFCKDVLLVFSVL